MPMLSFVSVTSILMRCFRIDLNFLWNILGIGTYIRSYV